MSLARMSVERRPRHHAASHVSDLEILLEKARRARDGARDGGAPSSVIDATNAVVSSAESMLARARAMLRFEEDRLGVKRDATMTEAQEIRLSKDEREALEAATLPAKPSHELLAGPGRCSCGWPGERRVTLKAWHAHARAARARGEEVR